MCTTPLKCSLGSLARLLLFIDDPQYLSLCCAWYILLSSPSIQIQWLKLHLNFDLKIIVQVLCQPFCAKTCTVNLNQSTYLRSSSIITRILISCVISLTDSIVWHHVLRLRWSVLLDPCHHGLQQRYVGNLPPASAPVILDISLHLLYFTSLHTTPHVHVLFSFARNTHGAGYLAHRHVQFNHAASRRSEDYWSRRYSQGQSIVQRRTKT